MHECFKREGIDKMLQNGEIDTLIMSHEHYDHFWALPVVLKYKPDIRIIIHEGFYPEGRQYIKDSGHKGELVVFKKGRNEIESGMCTFCYDCPIITRVFGEQSIFVNVKDKRAAAIRVSLPSRTLRTRSSSTITISSMVFTADFISRRLTTGILNTTIWLSD